MITFSLAAHSVQFTRRPQRPPRERSFVQPAAMSSGAERLGLDYVVKNDLIDLHWPAMDRTEKDDLLLFWRTSARGMANPFTFTDALGTAVSVRFAVPTLPRVKEMAPDAYAVDVQLRLQ